VTKDHNEANKIVPDKVTSQTLSGAEAVSGAKATQTQPPTKAAESGKAPKVSKPADRAKVTKAHAAMPTKIGLLWLLIILLMLMVASLGYWQWQAQTQRAALTTDQTGQSENLQYWQQQQQSLVLKLDQLSLTSDAQLRLVSAQQDALKDDQTRMDKALVRALEAMAKSQLDKGQVLPKWELAEAEYLLRLANQRLAMEQASESAVALLQAADVIIRDSKQVGTYGVRRAIAEDLVALTLVPSIDVEGVYASLAALSGLASELTFLPPQSNSLMNPKAPLDTLETSAVDLPAEGETWAQSAWRGTKQTGFSGWNELKQLVKVQSRTQEDQQLLTPAGELLVRMRIEMVVSQTQVALLRRQQTIYDQSLVAVKQLLAQYYRPTDRVVQAMHSQIDTLDEVKVMASIPNISGSLVTLQGFIAALHAGPAEPLVGE